jgi:hypothetical protein
VKRSEKSFFRFSLNRNEKIVSKKKHYMGSETKGKTLILFRFEAKQKIGSKTKNYWK